MSDIQPKADTPFAGQSHEFRLRRHVNVITGFVVCQLALPTNDLSTPEAIDWFILHDTAVQSELPDMIAEVKRQVTEKVTSR
jgi:hypothetical protein